MLRIYRTQNHQILIMLMPTTPSRARTGNSHDGLNIIRTGLHSLPRPVLFFSSYGICGSSSAYIMRLRVPHVFRDCKHPVREPLWHHIGNAKRPYGIRRVSYVPLRNPHGSRAGPTWSVMDTLKSPVSRQKITVPHGQNTGTGDRTGPVMGCDRHC